jgi:hypothetical protein
VRWYFFASESNKVYLFDINQKTATPVDADEVRPGGILSPAKKGERWGYINRKGVWAIRPEYDEVGLFRGRYAIVRLTNTTYSIDLDGKRRTLPATN